MILDQLVAAKKERSEYELRVLAALNLRYQINDKTGVAKKSATAGHVYSYLSVVLNEINTAKFRRKIKNILLTRDIIKPVCSLGIVWFKGLVGLEEDLIKAHERMVQHYLDRAAYRIRQRDAANKRYLKT